MNHPQRTRGNQRRRPQAKRPVPVDMWRSTGPLPDVAPIAITHDAGALVRSLGDPPMNNGTAAGYYFATVIERAAAVAIALAISADLLAEPDRD